ncbi:uncharacterized protein LOC107263102 isoform X2 [Cephus cinctus]|uniref:Uncharacterized protein LOC107263102 isoform X2 n=1 Tax=Cephus cinctus TaxID=211228 RepID=A0AAJ7BGG3_CEPCN|nr:uncharacterized protein LOC107263102 isoform X2 [Cephus cinctus]
MRNPAPRLVGIAASPGGGGVFGNRAEEELRQWLEARLDALGIDPVAYSRFVLSLLRRPDSALSPPAEAVGVGRGGGRRTRQRPRGWLPLPGDREQKRAAVQCLTSAADQKCGVESLVDELCAKLRELEGGGSSDEKEECKKTEVESKAAFESLTPRDKALRYYAAFPALQPATPKKFSQRKDRNVGNNNSNNKINCNNKNNSKNNTSNNNNRSNNNNNQKPRHRKTKMAFVTKEEVFLRMTIGGSNENPPTSERAFFQQAIDLRRSDEKENYGFAKSMEREREKERELELDQLRLAQLQAKFDQSLEALWDSGPGNAQNTASIWAAPSLSIPSGPLWPTDTIDATFALPISDKGHSAAVADTPYQESIIDDSPFIPWDIDLIGVEDYADESGNKEKSAEYNVNWSDSIMDGPWCWRDLGSNLATLNDSPRTGSCFFPVAPHKTPIGTGKQSRSNLKVNSLPDPDEDLLTSNRTHFRPIKDDGHWADGTTFPVNNTLERVAYRRSESGNLLYLPGGESPYMEYRESDSPPPAASSNLTLKFRDRFYHSPVGVGSSTIQDPVENEKDTFATGQLGWVQSSLPLHNDRKRRHSSSLRCRPLAALRPLTL